MSELVPISIITPSFNRAGMIVDAIESVLAQNYTNVEHIIVDGASTDGTLEVLSKYRHLKVISEKDDGMYAALNRGLGVAHGNIIGFLNTDDRFPSGIFSGIAEQFNSGHLDALIGRAAMYRLGAPEPEAILSVDPEKWWDTLILGVPIFNAWFFRKDVFDRLGSGFDMRFKIAGDRDFLIRFALANLHVEFSKDVFYEYGIHAGSLSLGRQSREVYSMLLEQLILVEKWLSQVQHRPELIKRFKRLSKEVITELVIQSLKDHSLSRMTEYISLGMQNDITFLPYLMRKLFTGIWSRLASRL